MDAGCPQAKAVQLSEPRDSASSSECSEASQQEHQEHQEPWTKKTHRLSIFIVLFASFCMLPSTKGLTIEVTGAHALKLLHELSQPLLHPNPVLDSDFILEIDTGKLSIMSFSSVFCSPPSSGVVSAFFLLLRCSGGRSQLSKSADSNADCSCLAGRESFF